MRTLFRSRVLALVVLGLLPSGAFGEEPMPEKSDARLVVQIGHTDRVSSVAFSPEGKQILTGGRDVTARLWDAQTGMELLAIKGPANPACSGVLSPDGNRILTGG